MSSTTVAVSREESFLSALPTIVAVVGALKLGGALFMLSVVGLQRLMLGGFERLAGDEAATGEVSSLFAEVHVIFLVVALWSGGVGIGLLLSRSWLKVRVHHRRCVVVMLAAAIPMGSEVTALAIALLAGAAVWTLTRPNVRATFSS